LRPKDHSHDQGDAQLVHLQHLKRATCLVKAHFKFVRHQLKNPLLALKFKINLSNTNDNDSYLKSQGVYF
jgi:hypothetical protein